MNWLPLGIAAERILTGQKCELGIDERNGAFVRVARDENWPKSVVDQGLSSDRFIRVRALEAIGKDCEVIVDTTKMTCQRGATRVLSDIELEKTVAGAAIAAVPPVVPSPLKVEHAVTTRDEEIERLRNSRDRAVETMKQITDDLIAERERVKWLWQKLESINRISLKEDFKQEKKG